MQSYVISNIICRLIEAFKLEFVVKIYLLRNSLVKVSIYREVILCQSIHKASIVYHHSQRPSHVAIISIEWLTLIFFLLNNQGHQIFQPEQKIIVFNWNYYFHLICFLFVPILVRDCVLKVTKLNYNCYKNVVSICLLFYLTLHDILFFDWTRYRTWHWYALKCSLNLFDYVFK